MKRSLLLSFLLSACFSPVFSQSYCITFGGAGTDYAYDVKATADGGFVVAGATDSYGGNGNEFYVVKFDNAGSMQWTRTIGDFGAELAYGIDVATNGDYVIAGETNSFGAGGECYIVRLDPAGNLLWTKSVGGSGVDYAKEIAATNDNGCVIVGTTTSYGQGLEDAYVVKLDSNGAMMWSTTLGSANTDNGFGIIEASDGSIVVAGKCFPGGFGGASLYLAKLNAIGVVVWGTQVSSHDINDFFVPGDIVETLGGYVVSGYSDTATGANKNNFLVKVSTPGVYQWTKIIGISGNDNGYSVSATADNGFIISGNYYGGTSDGYLVKTDGNGVPEWYIKSAGHGNDFSYAVCQLNDGSYISVGNTDAVDGSDMIIMKVDSFGTSCAAGQVTHSYGSLACTSGNFGTAGTGALADTGGTVSSGGVGLVSCASGAGIDEESSNLVQLYPNPANQEITIQGLEKFDHVSIVNSIGQVVYDSIVTNSIIKISLGHLPTGFYTIQLKSKDKLVTKKLLVE
jgi:hypothetical protein